MVSKPDGFPLRFHFLYLLVHGKMPKEEERDFVVKKDSLRRKRKKDCLRAALFSKKSSLFSHVCPRSQDLTQEWAMEEAIKRVTYVLDRMKASRQQQSENL